MIAEWNMNITGCLFHFCEYKNKSNLTYVTERKKM